MKVAIVGTGYVGLVSGVCLSDFGHSVSCVDLDNDKIDLLNSGGVPIYEPGLDVLVEKNIAEGRLSFTANIEQAVKDAEVVVLAVGTPPRPDDGGADLSYICTAAENAARHIQGYTVIVTKSTVPVGTGDQLEALMKAARPNAEFDVVSNPEFLREGAAIHDFTKPDRIIIGAETDRAAAVMRELYRPYTVSETPIVMTNRRTSELIKYAGNAFLATKITFINEMANLCEQVGASVNEVAYGIGLDTRIGAKFLNAGPGYGGSCFPKDTRAVADTARKAGTPLRIIETVIEVNKSRKSQMANKIISACGGDISGKTIAILGLSFKPDTDDMRESPSIPIIGALQAAGAKIRAYDPEAMDEARQHLSAITYCDDAYDCASGANALVLLTQWNQFRALDFERLGEIMEQKTMIDLRNIYQPDQLRAKGFAYSSIGRI